MNSDHRRQSVLSHEGQILAAAGNFGEDHAAEIARCAIDGAMNALIRIEGRKAAAEYAFALGDRVVAGIKGPTDLPIEAMIADAARQLKPQPVPAPPPDSTPPRRLRWLPSTESVLVWSIGFMAGVVVGSGLR